MKTSNKMLKIASPLLYASGLYQRRWQRHTQHDPYTVILAYHRIVEDQAFPAGRFDIERGTTASVFESQIRFMLKHFAPVQASLAQSTTSDQMRFSITLDDGYEDNFKVAAPILKKLGVPATFFVVSDYIGTDKLFWWEQLAHMIRTTPVPQIKLQKTKLSNANLPLCITLKKDSEREFAYEQLCKTIRGGLHEAVAAQMSQLSELLEVNPQKNGREYNLMNWDQLKELHSQGFEIGAHTASHCNVNGASQSMLKQEITASINHLENNMGAAILSFAYPYGHFDHNNNTTAKILQNTNCRAAFTTVKGVVNRHCNRFELPRTKLNRANHFACAYNIQDTINQNNGIIR